MSTFFLGIKKDSRHIWLLVTRGCGYDFANFDSGSIAWVGGVQYHPQGCGRRRKNNQSQTELPDSKIDCRYGLEKYPFDSILISPILAQRF